MLLLAYEGNFYMRSLFLLVSLFLCHNSFAQTTTSNIQTSAVLSGSCQVQTSDINIGAITPGQASSSGSTQVNVKCTKGTSYSWFPTFRQAGWDCPFLTGQNSNEKIYYMFFYDNHYQVYTSPMSANPVVGIGTGNWKNESLQVFVQPNQNYSTCPRQPSNPGFNPFVTPDSYSDSNTILLNF